MAKGTRNIEDWEVALIKAMLNDGGYTVDQIIAYFSRPNRTVNRFRIAEIRKGEIYEDVPAANEAQVRGFVRTYSSPGEARYRFFEENPLHPVNLASIFRLRGGTEDALEIDETDRVECKESLNFDNRNEYARVIASFANARGGFLVFGIRDTDKAVAGIASGKLNNHDPARLNQYLSEHFAPVPIWEKTEINLAGKTVGLIYVRPGLHKPIICTKDAGSILRESDIYYRYPGQTRRIKYAELVQILSERSRQTERQWADVLNRVEKAGVDNVAILDTAKGEVSGPTGRFLIDEKLVPKLKFVAEGHFSETEGAPTLKLIGDVQPLSAGDITPTKIVVHKIHLKDIDLLEDFVNLSKVADATHYIQHLAHSAKLWLPIFYYARQAGLNKHELVELIKKEEASTHRDLAKLLARIRNDATPRGACKPRSAEPERSAIISKRIQSPSTDGACHTFLKAVRTLTMQDLDPSYVLPILKHCFDQFRDTKRLGEIQYALAHVDVVWHLQVSGTHEVSPAFSGSAGNDEGWS